MKEKLEEAGFDWIDRAIRPMAITKDEKFAYLQISLFHGFFEYDIENDKITRKLDLPIPEKNKNLAPGDHLLASGHHGISLSGDDKTICVAGTMDGYIAIVDRETFKYSTIKLSDDPKEAFVPSLLEVTQYGFASFGSSERLIVLYLKVSLSTMAI